MHGTSPLNTIRHAEDYILEEVRVKNIYRSSQRRLAFVCDAEAYHHSLAVVDPTG